MLILLKQINVQAIEKTIIDTNWVTLLFAFLLACVFLLKGLSASKLKGNVSSLIYRGFIEKEVADISTFFNLFQSVIFIFSMLVLSLLFYDIGLYYAVFEVSGFYTYFKVFGVVVSYFLIKWVLEFSLSLLFLIKKQVKFFLVSKSIYLYSVTFFLLIVLVLTQYSQLNTIFLIYFSVSIFLTRFLVHSLSNKKLIFNKLFYFILYLCAFEIAPLFILFKLMF